MTIKSNYSYLPDGAVLDTASRALCSFGPAKPESVAVPVGRWLTAGRAFHLRGGRGGAGAGEWSDEGAPVQAGQRFRLVRRGTAASAAVWEIEAVRTKKIKLCNEFHNTEITLIATVDARGNLWLNKRQMTKARRALCGIKGCSCGDAAGCRPTMVEDQQDGSGRILSK